jgi:hypothetical protein
MVCDHETEPNRVAKGFELLAPTPPDMRVRIQRFQSDFGLGVSARSVVKRDPKELSSGTPCSVSHRLVSARCTLPLPLIRQYPFRLRLAMWTASGEIPKAISRRRRVRGCFHCFQ